MGTSSWGWAVDKRARSCESCSTGSAARFPQTASRVDVDTDDDIAALDENFARHAFGAQFVEVRVDVDTGEVRVPRHGRACSRPGASSTRTTARSQLIGGMTMGLSMALHEESRSSTRRSATA